MAQTDTATANSPVRRKRKLFLRVWQFCLPPEWDDCEQGAYIDEIDELLEEWIEDDTE